MPKIPTYQADRLASEHVGVPSQDQSGVIVANAVTKLASTAYSIIEEQKTKDQQLDISLARSKFSVDMARKEAEILGTPGLKSDDIERLYQEGGAEVKQGILDGYSDGGTRQLVDSELQTELGQFQVRAIDQRFKLKNAEKLNDIFSVAEKQVQASYTDAANYTKQVKELQGVKQSLLDRGYDLPAASKFIENALDNKAQYAIDDAIDNEQEAMAYTALNSGVFDSASTTKKEQISRQIAEALQTKSYRAELKTQASVLAQATDMASEYGSLSVKDMTHSLSQMEFQLDEGVKDKSLSPKQVENLTKTINYVETLRKSKLNMAYVQAYDDPNRKTEILAKLATTIKGSGRAAQRQPGVKLDELLEVRDDLLKAFVDDGKISRRTFEEYNAAILGAYAKGFTDEVFAGKFADLWRPPSGVRSMFAEGDQKNVVELFKAAQKQDGGYDPVTMQYVFDEYLADRRGDTPPTMITPQAAKDYARRGWLSRNGYGVDFKVGDYVPMKNGNWKIVAIGDLGVPTFEVPQEVADKINQIKAEKADGGSNR